MKTWRNIVIALVVIAWVVGVFCVPILRTVQGILVASAQSGAYVGAGLCPPGTVQTGNNINSPPRCSPTSSEGINPYTGGVRIQNNTTDGSSFINGLAQVMNTYYVDGFGAKGNGSTDDTASVHAAAAAACSAGGGIVRFSPTKNYKLTTGFVGGVCGPSKLDWPCSNLYYDAYGSTVMVTGNGFCMGNHCAIPESLTNACPITAGATAGSNTVTITTGGSCVTPVAGDPVIIQPNPFVSYFFITVNYVASISGSTITLLNPIGKTVTPNPSITDVANDWDHNIGWFGGIINSSGPYVFAPFAQDNGIVKDVTINDTASPANIVGGADFYGDVFDHDTWNAKCANVFNFGSRGSQATKVTNNVINEVGGPSACADTTGTYINYMALAGEASIDITFDHNTFSDSTGQGVIAVNPGGGGSFSQDTKFINNSAYFAPPVSTTVTHIPVEFNTANTIVSGNNFTRSSGTSFYNFIVDRGDAVFTNNTVNDYGTSGVTVQCGSNAVCNDNKIFTNMAGPQGLNMSVGAVAIGNYIDGPGSGTGIGINDPGSPSSVPVIAQDNVLLNWGTNVAFANLVNVLYPMVFNNGPGGLLYMINPANITDVLVAPGTTNVDLGSLGTGNLVAQPVLNIHSDASGGNNANFRLNYASAGIWDIAANSTPAENALESWTMQMNTNAGGAITFIYQPNGGSAANRYIFGSGGTFVSQGAVVTQGPSDTAPREEMVAGTGFLVGGGSSGATTIINEKGIVSEGQFLFAALATNLTVNFQHGICTDCKNVVTDAAVPGAACAGGGTGAIAFRVSAGVFQCN